jgi:hypothetical protein
MWSLNSLDGTYNKENYLDALAVLTQASPSPASVCDTAVQNTYRPGIEQWTTCYLSTPLRKDIIIGVVGDGSSLGISPHTDRYYVPLGGMFLVQLSAFVEKQLIAKREVIVLGGLYCFIKFSIVSACYRTGLFAGLEQNLCSSTERYADCIPETRRSRRSKGCTFSFSVWIAGSASHRELDEA